MDQQTREDFAEMLVAWLTDAMVLPAGAPVPRERLIHPRAEPEIVFVMGSRLAGPGVPAGYLAWPGAGSAPMLDRLGYRGGPAGDAELGAGAQQVRLDRGLADVECPADLGVRLPARHQRGGPRSRGRRAVRPGARLGADTAEPAGHRGASTVSPLAAARTLSASSARGCPSAGSRARRPRPRAGCRRRCRRWSAPRPCSRRRRPVASTPSPPGMRRSIRMTSGRSRSASATASGRTPPRRPPRCLARRPACRAAPRGRPGGRRPAGRGSTCRTVGTVALTWVPAPGELRTVSVPPASATRVRIPRRP